MKLLEDTTSIGEKIYFIENRNPYAEFGETTFEECACLTESHLKDSKWATKPVVVACKVHYKTQ